MKFNNVAFPYPLLNEADHTRDDYIDGDYQYFIENTDIDEQGFVEFTIGHQCSVDELLDLIDVKKASYCVLILCSDTLFRQSFLSSSDEQKIKIRAEYLHGKVEFVPQIVCTQTVEAYTSEFLNDEYGDVAFELSPGDVLATNETVVKYFEFNKLSFDSLINVRTSPDLPEFHYRTDLSNELVYIDTGIKMREILGYMRADKALRPYLAMSVYKDCFLFMLDELVNGEDSTSKRWARALESRLVELAIVLPENPTLSDLNEVAQTLLATESVKKLYQSVGAN